MAGAHSLKKGAARLSHAFPRLPSVGYIADKLRGAFVHGREY